MINKSSVIESLKNNGMELEHVSDELKNDKEVVFVAVKQNGMALEYASDELKKDKEIVKAAIIAYNFPEKESLTDEIKRFREIHKSSILGSSYHSESVLEFVSDELKDDYEIAKCVAENDPYSFGFLGPEMRKNKELAWLAFENTDFSCDPCSCLTSEVLDDEEFVLKAVEKEPFVFKEISSRLKGNKEIALTAIKNGVSLEYVSDELKKDRNVVLEAVRRNGHQLKYVSEKLKDDLLVVLNAIHSALYNPRYDRYDNPIIYASDRIKEYIRTHDVGFDTHWQEYLND